MISKLRPLALATYLTIGCTADDDAPAPDEAAQAEVTPSPSPRVGPTTADPRLAAAVELSRAVPASAGAIVHVRAPAGLFAVLTGFEWLGPQEAAEARALAEEVDAYLRERLGVELTEARSITLYYTDKPEGFGMIVEGVEGELRGTEQARHGDAVLRLVAGSDIVAAIHGTTLLLGPVDSVTAMLDGLDGKQPALADASEGLAKLVAERSPGAFLLIAAEASRMPAEVAQPAATYGIERAYVGVTAESIEAIAVGTPEGMKAAAALVSGALAQAQSEVERAKLEALEGEDLLVGVGAIIGVHTTRRFAVALAPSIEGDRMTISMPIPLGSPSTLIPLLGVAAAVAVPALQKYMTRAKTSEVKLNLARLHDATSAYFQAEHVDAADFLSDDANVAIHACPNNGDPEGEAGITPPLSVKCSEGPDAKCLPSAQPGPPGTYDSALWTDNPVWSGLDFAQDEGHAFHYNFIWANETSGYGNCQFTIQAFADLDDDGIYSTYERYGAGDVTGVAAAAGLFIDNELE
ncbi:hypothetical protein [Enhygromyxa salina]|nr:hypothetical protein [Enhygromyxa salina]